MGFVSESGKLPMDEVTEAVRTARRAVEGTAWAKEYDVEDAEEAPEEIVAIFPARELQVYRAKGATMRGEVPVWSLTKKQLATILQAYHPDCIGRDIEVVTIGNKTVQIIRRPQKTDEEPADDADEEAETEELPLVEKEGDDS